jgi:opacity protein-like surface antigen
MRTLKLALMASVAVAALTSVAAAADPIVMVEEPMAVPVVDNFFDWNGPYAGLYVSGQTVPSVFGIGADLGVNIVMDPILFGVEGDIAWLSDSTWQGQVHGRLGLIAAPELLLYGLAGWGAHSVNGSYVPVGAGAEFVLADNITLKAQYEYHWDTDTAAQSAHVGKLGFNFHF